MTALSAAELELALHSLPNWRLEQGKLMRDWTFADFVQALAFVNRVAEIAERAGHHPDIDMRYSRVRLSLVTHDAGGLTARDLEMAHQLDEVLEPR